MSDLEDVGLSLIPRVVRHELHRRIPGADVRAYAPFGHQRGSRLDSGEPAEPLGQWGAARLDELASALDCVLVGGGDLLRPPADLAADYGPDVRPLGERAASSFFVEGLGPEREAAVPVVWNGVGLQAPPGPEEASRFKGALSHRDYLTVRDDQTRQWLEAAGVDRDITVVPDCTLLAPRLFPPSVLHKRLEYLKVMGWFPAEGEAVVVQGSAALAARAQPLADAVNRLLEEDAGRAVVLAQLSPYRGDAAFVEALTARLPPDRTYHLPPIASHEDVAAVLATCAAFAGDALFGCLAAYAFGRPVALLDVGLQQAPALAGFAALAGEQDQLVREPAELAASLGRRSGGAGTPPMLTALQDRLDDHFDRVAEMGRAAAANRAAGSEQQASLQARLRDAEARLEAVLRAHQVQGERLAAERARLGDLVVQLQRQLALSRHDADANRRLARAEAALRATVEAELEALRETKVLRWTSGARSAYGRLRRRDR